MVARRTLAKESFCSASCTKAHNISVVKWAFLWTGLANVLFKSSKVFLTRELDVGDSMPAKEWAQASPIIASSAETLDTLDAADIM